MMPLDRFHSFISENGLFDHSSRILLAVSGGKDSVLMTCFFADAGYTFGIAHCNFKLRAEESDLDEGFTRDLAAQLNVPFYTTRFDTKENARSEHISIQMAARSLRYIWLEKIRRENNYDWIALAHHQNDSIETVLLNLVRGTGISGLHGIKPKHSYLVRPMLFLMREEIDKLIIKENISYREDSSNLSAKYARNKIRMEVIPRLKELNPSLEETFEKNSRHFEGIEEYFKQQMGILRDQLFKETGGGYTIEVKQLTELKPRQTLLFELFRPFNFNENVLNDLTASWDGNPGKIFESATHILLLDRDKLILRSKHEDIIEDTLILKDDMSLRRGEYTFTMQQVARKGLQLTGNPDRAYFDAALINFPLKLRSWRKGDSFYPLGMTGKKKLSDFFINKKIPLSEKQNVPILENGNGDILWVAGYQSDERYKVSPQSEKVIIFGIQNNGE